MLDGFKSEPRRSWIAAELLLHFRFPAPAGRKQANVPRGVAANICGIERHQAMSSDDPQVLIEAAKQRDKRFPSGTGLFQAKRPEFK